MCGDAPAAFDPSAFSSSIPSVAQGNYNLGGAQENAAMVQSRYPWITPPQDAFAGATGGAGGSGGGKMAGGSNPFLELVQKATDAGEGVGYRMRTGESMDAQKRKQQQQQGMGQNPLADLTGQGGGGQGQISMEAILKALSMFGGGGGAGA